MGSAVGGIAKQIECPICYEMFNSQLKVPMVIGCGHTVCNQCIKNMSNCPICKFNFRKGGNTNLPKKNFTLLKLLEDSSLRESIQLLQAQGQSSLPFQPVTPVITDSSAFASLCEKTLLGETILCSDCMEIICETCQRQMHHNHNLKLPPPNLLPLLKELTACNGRLVMTDKYTNIKYEFEQRTLQRIEESKSNAFSCVYRAIDKIKELLKTIENEYSTRINTFYGNLTKEVRDRCIQMDKSYNELKTSSNRIRNLIKDLLGKVYVYNVADPSKESSIEKEVKDLTKTGALATLSTYIDELSNFEQKYPDFLRAVQDNNRIYSYQSLVQLIKLPPNQVVTTFTPYAYNMNFPDLSAQKKSLISTIKTMLKIYSLQEDLVDILLIRSICREDVRAGIIYPSE